MIYKGLLLERLRGQGKITPGGGERRCVLILMDHVLNRLAHQKPKPRFIPNYPYLALFGPDTRPSGRLLFRDAPAWKGGVLRRKPLMTPAHGKIGEVFVYLLTAVTHPFY